MIDAINMRTIDKPGVLRKVTDYLAKNGINIVYTHLYMESDDHASTYIELDHVDNIEEVLSEIMEFPEVKEVKLSPSMDKVWGKRIIIVGGGAQVSQVALGAITEADRHNIRGERISIDTLPLTGEKKIIEALEAIGYLPRVSCIVLAESEIEDSIIGVIDEIKNNYNIKIVGLNGNDSLINHLDLVVTDPLQAGVMAVMAISETSNLDISRIKEVL